MLLLFVTPDFKCTPVLACGALGDSNIYTCFFLVIKGRCVEKCHLHDKKLNVFPCVFKWGQKVSFHLDDLVNLFNCCFYCESLYIKLAELQLLLSNLPTRETISVLYTVISSYDHTKLVNITKVK